MCLIVLISISLLSPFVPAAALSTFSPTTLLPPQPPPPLFPSNTTNTTTSSSNAIQFNCDGTLYGRISRPSSCLDVFNYILKSTVQTTFSNRHTGRPNDVPLPLRILSSDGLCFVQPFLVAGASSGHASSTELGRAGYVVLQRCVVERGIGGVAGNIGGDNNLNVAVADYEPRVRCDRSLAKGPPWESCLRIVADMAASKERMVFGNKRTDPRVEVGLPFYYKAVDARCQASIEISGGKSTSATWYEIWEAMSALAAMCVRAEEKGGKAFGMGLRKNIFIQISDENPDLSPNAVTTVGGNVSTAGALFLGLGAGNGSLEVA